MATTMTAPTAALAEDIGNIVSMEHVNTTIPDQSISTIFYVLGLGFTRDPYMNVGLANMWINIGDQQFHLPTNKPQVLRGHVGLVVRNLDALKARLGHNARALFEKHYTEARMLDSYRELYAGLPGASSEAADIAARFSLPDWAARQPKGRGI